MKIKKIVLVGLLSLGLLTIKPENLGDKSEKNKNSVNLSTAGTLQVNTLQIDTIQIPQESLEVYQKWIDSVINETKKRRSYGIIVYKLDRKLELYRCGELVKIYSPIGLGPNPIDAKQRVGDGCTPEGVFYVCAKNPQSVFYRSLLISYPNEEAAKKGLEAKLISEAKYNAIMKALRRKGIPPQYTALGGEICIHGGPTEYDWTLGCVAVGDSAAAELFSLVKIGDPVTIVKGAKAEYLVPKYLIQKVPAQKVY